jgi:dipeptidase E
MMNDQRPIETILKLVNKPFQDVQVLYLGTATYDIDKFQVRQTQRFTEMGCQVKSLQVSDQAPSDMERNIDEADVIVVGGGNTLYAVDRWRNLNMIPPLRKAIERGAVMTGGSAGAICWFDGGHSGTSIGCLMQQIVLSSLTRCVILYHYFIIDSMDPDTYKKSMLSKFSDSSIVVKDESSTTGLSSEAPKEWEYIRVDALGFLPGLVCPHHDRIQSNGVLRANDFDRLLLQSPRELGIAIDHWAALVIDGEDYYVMSLEDKEGSVLNEKDWVTNGSGKPGIWIKEVVNDGQEVYQQICPRQGKVKDLFRVASKITNNEDALLQCRIENPQP